MRTTMGIAVMSAAVLLVGCASEPALNRDQEVAANQAVGITVEPSAKGVLVRLPETVLFDFDKSNLRADAGPVVDRSVVLLSRSDRPIEVNGYTDNVGTREYNQHLSEARAEMVADALIQRGIAASRVTTHGFAFDNPVVTNDTAQGRALNRRTEIVLPGEHLENIMGPQK
ncbi:OmpA family protein [Burkholderia sp. SIMBA_043]|uniref:Flagellar motor protein MotB n=2 Tax=Burkholderia cepacia complex TaxID=87882 RepID=A0A1B4LHI6_9BURK|nr:MULTISPECIES: OmpA family protein [Burkholderia cepacia complex]AJY08028.1 ompA family protein [Burkholderia vietnamiensis LMG 10929]AOJ76671.1 flagellar motor protein MotB [Burkholderia ubonensis]AOK13759.1 flagellar motor protein MotB [Burkholderia vietnamiensis]AVR14850.1 OmpA family protein [Burkholderia vietnamiensis]KVE66864.1 flagellar motor protein MotB [Burkholderia vietnamiensis]